MKNLDTIIFIISLFIIVYYISKVPNKPSTVVIESVNIYDTSKYTINFKPTITETQQSPIDLKLFVEDTNNLREVLKAFEKTLKEHLATNIYKFTHQDSLIKEDFKITVKENKIDSFERVAEFLRPTTINTLKKSPNSLLTGISAYSSNNNLSLSLKLGYRDKKDNMFIYGFDPFQDKLDKYSFTYIKTIPIKKY